MVKDLLFNEFKSFDERGLFSENFEVPNYIKLNLKDSLRPYQKEAIRFLHYSQRNADDQYNHLLFNMATGSGKTMIMAALMLYMFKTQGYQNFIFFVNTETIIQKTKENLLNPLSSKYLFSQSIEIDGEQIKIEEVTTFPNQPDKNTIYLKVSTIHKIHDELNHPRENSVTYEDLKELSIVLLADEAHHFNAATKAKGKAKNSKENEEASWEKTIYEIVKLQPKNRLFEFTATIDLTKQDIYQKYKDKIIYQYDLKQFMMDGFSKKVMLLEADQNDNDKMLDAVLLSQYRKMVASDHGIAHFKPIILFKSNQIAVSKSKQIAFVEMITALTPDKISKHLNAKASCIQSTTSIWHKLVERYRKDDFVKTIESIQEDFNEMNLLNLNKTDVLEEYPILMNTMESIDNPIRAVFAVAKANEGWDVLNLYDIVRINEKSSNTKAGTDSEAQLIGRGARYYPFTYDGEKSYKRRFDKGASDLAVLEQLHYHTINEPDYIKTLHKSLKSADIIAHQDGNGIVEHARLKNDFKKSAVYQKGRLFYNEVIEAKNVDKTWDSYSLEEVFDISYQTAQEVKFESINQEMTQELGSEQLELDSRYYFKAMQRIPFFTFENLKKYFPLLESMKQFICCQLYLGKIKIQVTLPINVKLSNLSAKDKLDLLEVVLSRIANNLRKNYDKVRGTHNFISKPLKDFIKDYSVYIDNDFSMLQNQKIDAKPTMGKKWYVYDQAILNQTEHKLVKLMSSFMEKLKYKYDDIYLIRNDESSSGFKLREFDGVRGFMPDFILVMTGKEYSEYYQVFIEPKGENRLLDDKWKQEMLKAINNQDLITIEENENVRLMGIKFFVASKQEVFIKDFEEKLYEGKQLQDGTQIELKGTLL